MTKSLLVNCSFSNKIDEDLFAVISQFSECIVTNFDDITLNYQITNDFDAIVISGSAARIVQASDRAKFENVEMLIKNCCVPLLGICFGHQLLCWAFGAEVGSLPQQVANQFEDIKVIQVGEIFAGFKEQQTIPLAENHFDYVLKDSLDSAGFLLLADSSSCEVEAARHITKPFYGVQFHPERITIKGEKHSEGHAIIQNFYSNVVKR
jgi:GMP synthase-like glutamine amidotransferase